MNSLRIDIVGIVSTILTCARENSFGGRRNQVVFSHGMSDFDDDRDIDVENDDDVYSKKSELFEWGPLSRFRRISTRDVITTHWNDVEEITSKTVSRV